MIASRAYQLNFDHKYTLPAFFNAPNMLKESEMHYLEHDTKKWKSDAFNDRGVFMYLRGEYSKALEFFKEAETIDAHNLEAFVNNRLLKWG